MSALPEPSDSSSHEGPAPSYTGMPRWVKWFVVLAVVLAILLLVGAALAGGEHGPGRHVSQGLPSDPSPAAAGVR
jgi:hypothetical protein